jgi:hypothetical protein
MKECILFFMLLLLVGVSAAGFGAVFVVSGGFPGRAGVVGVSPLKASVSPRIKCSTPQKFCFTPLILFESL